MNSICVFAGSSPGNNPAFLAAASDLGKSIAERGMKMVYGGASVGLMRAAADGALSAGGEVIGVLPTVIADMELAHPGLTELHHVSTMHERKALMADLSDAFVALPGGVGTLEETFEAWTWTQLAIHSKPVGLLNVDGFYDSLVTFLNHVTDEGFVRDAHRGILKCSASPGHLLDELAAFEFPTVKKWIER